jgi:thiamine-phosphate pyrophosphorylase
MNDFGLYVIITKPQHLSYAEIAHKCVSHGVRMLQLREKHLSDKELIAAGHEIRRITRGTNTSFVINDRPDIAVICEADYLHLGQDDISIDDARRIVGDMKIGLSTHSLQQAREALTKNPAYIGFGPVFPTNAKAKPDAPVGTELLSEVVGFSHVPVVAIGGIFPDNMDRVTAAGARNVAMVRHLMQSVDFDERVDEMTNLLNLT